MMSTAMTHPSASRQPASDGSPRDPRGLRGPRGPHGLCGFTLIELLVAISIVVMLLAVTVTSINFTLERDRVRGAARNSQSYLGGARDRAIYSGSRKDSEAPVAVGVRFIPEPGFNDLVNTMIYVEESAPYKTGRVRVGRPDANLDGTADVDALTRVRLIPVAGEPAPDWFALVRNGRLVDGARITFGNGQLSRVVGLTSLRGPNNKWGNDTANPDPVKFPLGDPQFAGQGDDVATLELTTPAFDTTVVHASPDVNATDGIAYSLQLAPAAGGGQEARTLGNGVVVDLSKSHIPASWTNRERMDLLFSPRGSLTGPAAVEGLVHLFVTDRADAVSGEPPRRDQFIVTVATQTGRISVHPVSTNPANPFEFAEKGQVAGQ